MNKRKRGMLSQSALSSTPELVGEPSLDTPCPRACRRTGSVQQTPEPPGRVQGRTQTTSPSSIFCLWVFARSSPGFEAVDGRADRVRGGRPQHLQPLDGNANDKRALLEAVTT